MEDLPSVRDPRRLRDLRASSLLDSPVEETFDRITRLLCRVLGVPVALVSLVDEDRQFFKSQVGLGEPWASRRETPLSHSFCQLAVSTDQPLVVEDSVHDPRVQGNLAISDLGVLAYAGVPVHGLEGTPLGALCAIDHAPRAWSDEDLALIAELADLTSELVAMRSAALATRAAVLDLSHEVRTAVAAVRLEADGLDVPEADGVRDGLARLSDAVTTALARVDEVRQGHEESLDVQDALRAAVDRLGPAASRRTVTALPGEPVAVCAAGADLAGVLDRMLHVVLRHGRGDVWLSATATGPLVRVRLQDEGDGLPDDVARDLLGRADGGSGGEPSLAEHVARALGGRLVLTSSSPTTLDLLLPAAP